MLVSQNDIRNRIDELKLSQAGYAKQMNSAYTTAERRERLENDVRLLDEEIKTLEKIAQLGAADTDRDRIEQIVRERLTEMRTRLAADPALAPFPEEQRDLASGEVKALVWALGEDQITNAVREMVAGRERMSPRLTEKTLPTVLMQRLHNSPAADQRAMAAYELGKLRVLEAIPRLVSALNDDSLVADTAFGALTEFSAEELAEAGVPAHLSDQVAAAKEAKQKSPQGDN